MGSCDHLQALMTKNFILMKRNCFATLCEILFPMILMILLALVKSIFKSTDRMIDVSDSDFLISNSSAYPSINYLSKMLSNSSQNSTNNTSNYSFYGLNVNSGLFSRMCLRKGRRTIALVGTYPGNFNKSITTYFQNLNFTTKNFNDTSELINYANSTNWNTSSNYPPICFGIAFQSIGVDSYNYSLLYFDASQQNDRGFPDIPNQAKPSLNQFQYGPDLSSFNKWMFSGYLEMMTYINNAILQISMNITNVQLNTAIASQKFYSFKSDPFSQAIGFILPFFLVIAYVCPLCIVVFRMVSDKESRTKEGMKIMGLSEGVYFNSYFLQYLMLNTIYSIINSLILTRVLRQVPYGYIFLFFWLYGMTVFSMCYLFQSFVDKTRIAVIISIIVYFVMYFISQAFFSDTILNGSKMAVSLFPPAALALGVIVFSQFEVALLPFDSSKLNMTFQNYSVGNMYTMLIIDVLIYLFVGFYLQNVLPQQFGTRKPFYFLFTREYWCNTPKISFMDETLKELKEKDKTIEEEFFQNEDNYEEQFKNGDCLKINKIIKTYDDGKTALNGLNLNIYNNEIFALLGHNGAGKSTLISILSGLYEATAGSVSFNNEEVLSNMDKFRKNLGICPQHDVLFDKLTQREHLNMFAVYKGIPSEQREEEVNKILNDMGILNIADTLAENLSGGQKRKLSIAIALLGGSKIVFLDEPSSGMDITSRRKLWDILKKSCSNKIIILTTHFMEEASVLGNRIGIVSNGKLKCCGTGLFLIDKFGKFISLTIAKEKNANDDEIIKFIKEKINNLEHEILSEEILIKIPKHDKINLKEFFIELDENLRHLKIKSYGVSMPTLEDVFLNVSADLHNKPRLKSINSQDEKGDKNLEINGYSYDMYEREKEGEVIGCHKFCVDLNASLYKRFIQLIRDHKTFILEVFCPIILTLIGCFIASVNFLVDSNPKQFNLGLLPTPQTISYNPIPYIFNGINSSSIFVNSSVENFSAYQNLTPYNSSINALVDFNNYIFQSNATNNLAGYFVLNFDNVSKIYESIVFVNTIAQDAAPIFYQDMMTNMINKICGRPINIQSNVVALPMTYINKSQSKVRNSSNLVFFVSIAFALIPANFITIIIREKEKNTKHLQIVSGISLFAYWLSNVIFELVKYYTTGAICLALMSAYSQSTNEMWVIYFIYGLTMIPFTYLFTFFFSAEATAQNFVILLNFLFGALGGTIVFVIRVIDSTVTYAKPIASIMRIIPAFSLSYSFICCLSSTVLANFDKVTDINLLSLDYAGSDIAYLAIISILSTFTIFLCELFQNKLSFTNNLNSPPQYEINDTEVKNEISLINNKTHDEDFAVEIKNLEKNYSDCYDPLMKNAVDKISFHLAKGECFALLGLNGAGKTTTFKCLTCEIFPTSGEIKINGLELTENFTKVRNMIGYCPQFDAIFDYMTVYENLYFYSCIKGIPYDKRDLIVFSLMKEMNLHEYAEKEAGNLSGGNRRKLSVATALIGNPQIVLLDEPSTGVDPEARRFMWSVIHKISVTRKQSSVILTTHSMEEAETLCRRMGIMVQGQFRCLGTSQSIKNKYGSGYEVDLTINNITEENLAQMLNSLNLNKDHHVETKDILNIFKKIDKKKYAELINPNNFGAELYEEFNSKGSCSIKRIINWSNVTENLLKLCEKLSGFYNNVSLAEFYDNNFKLKILDPKNNMNNNTIGFLIGLFEDYKTEFHVTEYGVSMASLEQIFNKFAKEVESTNLNMKANAKSKIDFTHELLEHFLRI